MSTSDRITNSVSAAVGEAVRAGEQELWARHIAVQASAGNDTQVTVADAREALLNLAAAGLLDLWYVGMDADGNETGRVKHPQTPGSWDDVYLMFQPTDVMRHVAGFTAAT